jgi:hypothetical protein
MTTEDRVNGSASDPPLLFLDIDGVLLRRRHSGMFDGFELAPHCLEFLEWATACFRCRWLTSRCRQGFLDGSHRAFRQAGASTADPRWQVLQQIERAAWSVSKIEAIDPASDFWWLDDDPSEHDQQWLRAHRRLDRLIEISCDQDPDGLLQARLRLMVPTAAPATAMPATAPAMPPVVADSNTGTPITAAPARITPIPAVPAPTCMPATAMPATAMPATAMPATAPSAMPAAPAPTGMPPPTRFGATDAE